MRRRIGSWRDLHVEKPMLDARQQVVAEQFELVGVGGTGDLTLHGLDVAGELVVAVHIGDPAGEVLARGVMTEHAFRCPGDLVVELRQAPGHGAGQLLVVLAEPEAAVGTKRRRRVLVPMPDVVGNSWGKLHLVRHRGAAAVKRRPTKLAGRQFEHHVETVADDRRQPVGMVRDDEIPQVVGREESC